MPCADGPVKRLTVRPGRMPSVRGSCFGREIFADLAVAVGEAVRAICRSATAAAGAHSRRCRRRAPRSAPRAWLSAPSASMIVDAVGMAPGVGGDAQHPRLRADFEIAGRHRLLHEGQVDGRLGVDVAAEEGIEAAIGAGRPAVVRDRVDAGGNRIGMVAERLAGLAEMLADSPADAQRRQRIALAAIAFDRDCRP